MTDHILNLALQKHSQKTIINHFAMLEITLKSKTRAFLKTQAILFDSEQSKNEQLLS